MRLTINTFFLDPNPNPEISFQERKRLFHLPRWLSALDIVEVRNTTTVERSKVATVYFTL